MAEQARKIRKNSGRALPVKTALPPGEASRSATEVVAAKARANGTVICISLLLFLLTVGVFLPALRGQFIPFDDYYYINGNAHVKTGLTAMNAQWAFVSLEHSNWHPVTWLSHMLDCQLYGLKPWGHHLTGVLFHAANTLLVFLLWRRLTGSVWRSLAVAVLFGWHPLRVESVAAICERKDVLSTFFFLLTLGTFARFAARREERVAEARDLRYASAKPRTEPCPACFYLLALALFACGLMSKTMLVTLPAVLLLLDYWPLGRMSRSTFPRLALEKAPFVALAAVASTLEYAAQHSGGRIASATALPWLSRMENAVVSYVRYLGKMFWPADLCVFYPHPGQWPLVSALACALLLLGISLAVFLLRRRQPALLVGWLWYLGTLTPVIGLVQIGEQSMADRYTYIPSLGLLLGLVWGIAELTRHWRRRVIVLSVAGSTAALACAWLTQYQIGFWKDGITLFSRAVAVTKDNYVAHSNLGSLLKQEKRQDEALMHFRESARLRPNSAEEQNNVASVLLDQGKLDEATIHFQQALKLDPGFARAQQNLGNILCRQGRQDEAIPYFEKLIQLNPRFPGTTNLLGKAHSVLGIILCSKGRLDEAIPHLQKAAELLPGDVTIANLLGGALFRKGRLDEALVYTTKALKIHPHANLYHNLGLILSERGQVQEAITNFQQAVKLMPDVPGNHSDLGLAYLKAKRTDEAVRELKEALRLNPDAAAPHGFLGSALAEQGQLDAAIAEFREALRLDPSHVYARTNLAAALAKKENDTKPTAAPR